MEIPRTLVVTNDFPPRVGGIQRTLESLCRELPAEKVSVIAPSCEGSEAFDEAAGFEWSGSAGGSCGRRPRSPIVSKPRSRGRAPRWSCSVTRSHWRCWGLVWPRGGCPRRPRARVRLLALHRAGRPRRDETDDLASLAGGGCSEFISRRVRTAVPRHVPVSVLYPGADVERFRPDLPTADIRARHGLGDRPLIVCVSRLVPRKGQDVLITVDAGGPAAGPGGRLADRRLAVPYEAKLRGLAERAPTGPCPSWARSPRRTSPGTTPSVTSSRCRAGRAWAGSRWRGGGTSSSRRPPAGVRWWWATPGGRARRWCTVRPGSSWTAPDVDGVADAVATLLEDPAYARRLGKAGRARVEREHTWPLVAERLAGWLRDGRGRLTRLHGPGGSRRYAGRRG